MELIMVLACGVFFIATAVISYIRQSKDFENALKETKGGIKKWTFT